MAAPSGCYQVTRIVLTLLNILFVLFGFALLGFGIYITASKKFDIAFFEDIHAKIIGGEAMEIVGITLISVGIFTVLLSIFGCLGALLQNKKFLYLYTIILIVLMLVELAAFITTMSYRVRIRDSYKSGLRTVFTDAYETDRTDLIPAIERLEVEFTCCGVDGFKDYLAIGRPVPLSCCRNKQACVTPFAKGCADAITDWIWDELPITGSIIGVVLLFEVFGIISSISLVVTISRLSYGQIHGRL